MNAPHPLQTAMAVPVAAASDDENEIGLMEYWDIIFDNRWLVLIITALAIAIGTAYAFLARPIYAANLLIQVEDSAGSAKNFLGEAASFFDVKTAAASEIEIIRSRMVLGQAVDSTMFYVEAMPHYLPVVGNWLSRRASGLSDPGIWGLGGFVSGTEKIEVPSFEVPPVLEGSGFRLTARGGGRYELSHPDVPEKMVGIIGTRLVRSTPVGTISLLVSRIDAKPGADFDVTRRSRLSTIEDLQTNLKLTEKGRQSGVIDASLQSPEPQKLTLILNEIGRQYVRQNIERKAAEAQKMLAFLGVQMPQFKKQLESAEEAYNRYRARQGTVALGEEATLILTRSVELQGKLLDAQQKRVGLVARFTGEHPAVKTLDEEIDVWKREIAGLSAKVHTLPAVQQDALRLERDVKVNNDAYQSLQNNALQLQLVREGKVGNVRLIDNAALPELPVKPQRALVLGLAAVLGLLGGVLLALARNAAFRGIRNAQEIEAHTGLSVYSTIPLSLSQQELTITAQQHNGTGLYLLAARSPHDAAIESLRSLRTALQFAMLEAPNNRVLITGATPGAGKSFVAANLAAILAGGGKRVLLVDADLRKGHLNTLFGIGRGRGLSELVAGSLKASEAVRSGLLPNLDLLTTGVLPPNPAELMMSSSFARAMDELAPRYDLVIMDTPPVLVAADTMGVATIAGTVLLVARAGQTQLGELHESAKRLAHAGKSVSGVVFNAIDLSQRHYASYGYRHGRYKYRQYSYEAAPLKQ